MYITRTKNILTFSLLVTMSLAPSSTAWSARSQLQIPSLGDGSAGLISPTEEYELGQKVLRYYRASMPTSTDPFIETYLKQLLQRLVAYSDLTDKRLEILVLESPTLNAFAAPGGIIGVNTGTFLIAENEQQLSSIMTHELAHLSQRHYARSVQKQKKDSFATMAAMLASIVIASTTSGDAGIAAIAATQAGAIDSRLRFSRHMEAEADRIGMQTMVDAGLDPYAMPEMFELLMANTRFRTKVPEFLLSHPITENRISDSMQRATRYPRRFQERDEDFQIVRARIIYQHENNPKAAAARFRSELNENTLSAFAARYGLIRSLTALEEFEEAAQHIALLEKEAPSANHPALIIAKADLAAAQRDFDKAAAIMTGALKHSPTNHIFNIRFAEILMEATRHKECEALLKAHVKRQPKNAYTWYLLAEVHGLAGNIFDVHMARAEYFILHGIYNKAEIQLKNALKMVGEDKHQRAHIEQRLYDVRLLKDEKL